MPEEKLGNKKVKDISSLIVKNAATLNKDASMDELLEKIIEDTRSRHVYIVDENSNLLGSVRLNNVVEYLFPNTTLLETSNNMFVMKFLSYSSAKLVEDIMINSPSFVYEETSLSEMVQIMIREKVNELPVIDQNRKIIGEVNILEVISYYTKFIKKATKPLID